MRDRQDRNPRLAFRGPEQARDVEGLSFHPGREARRGQEVVQGHGQLETLLRREEGVDVQHTELLERRILDGADQLGQVEVAAFVPGVLDDVREQDRFTALDRIRIDAEQREQPGDASLDLLADGFGVFHQRGRRRVEGLEQADRTTGGAPRCVDGEVGRVAQALDALAVLPPIRESVAPEVRRLLGEGRGVHALARRFAGVHPRFEVPGLELGERQEQVPHVSLRIDHDGGNAVDRRFLEQADPEPRLAATGHAHAHRVRRQVLGVVEQNLVVRLTGRLVLGASEIERAQLLEVLHRGPRAGGATR